MSKNRVHKFSFICIVTCLLLLFPSIFKAQCFQIQSILVDACDGNNEGQNEMVIFQVGNTALNTSDLTANWANASNSWLGICQNASTSAAVSAINSTIIGCGFLKEPVGGVLPPRSTVLLITSTAFNPSAQSFVNLNDTLIVIFQCAGNTAGHFANHGTGIRTLSMNFSSPSSCSDIVSYDRNLLLDQNLLPGAEDGATVLFSSSGNASYTNRGCQAPYLPLTVDAGVNRVVCNTSPQSLTAIASGNYTTVKWKLGANATGVFSQTNSLTTVYTPGVGDAGVVKLYCEVSKSCSTQTVTAKDSISLMFYQLAQPIISSTSNTLCSGQSSTLSYSLSNASSTGTTSILWLPSNSVSSTISVNTTNTYSLQVTNACGNATATYSITSYVTPTVSISASGPTRLCAGSDVTLTAVSNINNVLWSNGVTSQSIIVNTTSTMSVNVNNVCGNAQATQTVNVSASSFTLSVNTNSITCFGANNGSASSVINGGNAPYTYGWSSSGVNTPSVNNLSTGNYTLTVTDFNNCVNTQTFVINEPSNLVAVCASTAATCVGNNGVATVSVTGGQQPYSYIWTPVNLNLSSISNLANGNYSVLVSDNNNCLVSATTTLSSTNTLSLSVTSTNESCFGYADATATANVSGGNAPYNYQWSSLTATSNSVNNLVIGAYTITVTDVNSCTRSNTFVITQPSALSVVSNGKSSCESQSVTLSANALGGTSPYSYSWENGLITDQNYIINAVTQTKTFSVIATDRNGCTANDTALVDIIPAPLFDLLSDLQSGCPNLCVDFRDTLLNPSSISNWQWNFGDGTFANTPTATHCYSNSGTYTLTLTLTNNLGCSKTIVKPNYITVYPKPKADFSLPTYELDVEEAEVVFTNLSTNATAWNWNFNDGPNSVSSLQNPSHTFFNEGNFTTTLLVTNRYNCKDSISKKINVTSSFTFYAPNTFIPNSLLSSKNAIFLPVGVNWDKNNYSLHIFDRWGKVVFSTNDYTIGWDGMVNNQFVKEDVYLWKVKVKDTHEKLHEYIGHVTLILK